MIIIIDGPSCAGKSTVIKLLTTYDERFVFVTSYTTRQMRSNETEGDPYHFISREQFESKIDDFIEHAEIHGNLYGKSKTEIDGILKQHKIPVLDVDHQGIAKYKHLYNDIYYIFITASEDTLRYRMLLRDGKIDPIRMKNGRKEIRYYETHPRMFNLYFDTDYDDAWQVVDHIVYEINDTTKRVCIISKNTARVDFYIYRWNKWQLKVQYDKMNNIQRSEIVSELCRMLDMDSPDGFYFYDDYLTFELHVEEDFGEWIMHIPKVYI